MSNFEIHFETVNGQQVCRFEYPDDATESEKLTFACRNGDSTFVNEFLTKTEDELHVDWNEMVTKAPQSHYAVGKREVLRCIRDKANVSLDFQLYASCLIGDLAFVLTCVTNDSDNGQNVDWERLIETAHDNKDKYIVRCIRDSGRVSVKLQVYYSCLLGDDKFVSQCIKQNKDKEQDVDWEEMMQIACEGGGKFKDLVRCIRDSDRVPLDVPKMLEWACTHGDVEFVSLCITDEKDKGYDVNWGELLSIAYDRLQFRDALADRCKHIAQQIVESGRYDLGDLVNHMYSNPYTEFIIQHTDDINRDIQPGLTPLHALCKELASMEPYNFTLNHPKHITTLIIEKGSHVNKKDSLGRTPLHVLCYSTYGQNDQVHSIEIEQGQEKKNLVMSGGVITGDTVQKIKEVIILIIENDGDVNATDENGQTPLHMLSLCEGGENLANLLLTNGALINIRDMGGLTPLAVAAQSDRLGMVKCLCAHGCEIDLPTHEGRTPLFLSVVNRSEPWRDSSTDFLCEQGADVNKVDAYNITPLAAACEVDDVRSLQALLKHKGDPSISDREGKTPLHKTARYGSINSCKELLGVNVSLDAKDITGCTALHASATYHQLTISKALLDAGCNPNIESNLGELPLHITTSLDNAEHSEILIQEGACIDHKNNYGYSPLMLSANRLNTSMMKYLIKRKANVETTDNMHRSLIHNVVASLSSACKFQAYKEIIESLLQQGLSINAVDMNKQTPLHLASKDRAVEFVSYLVDKGSDMALRDTFGHIPLMNALENQEVFWYLWNKTLPTLTDDDFCQLQRLSHWLSIDDSVKEVINRHTSVQLDIANKPQNVRTLKIRYDPNLEKWLRSDQEALPDFMSSWLPSLQSLTYVDHPEINKVLRNFLQDLQNDVKIHSPFVAYLMQICGSVEEATKAFAQDEYDCSCVQQNIRFEMFEITKPTKEDHKVLKAFVHLTCKDEFQNELQLFLDEKKRLSQGKLCCHFGKAIGKSLANPELLAKYPQLQRVSAKDISAGDRRICTMQVIWSDEICPLLTIDIDLAPVIDLLEWKPSWCNQHPLVNEISCIALPKWKMTHDVEMNLMEIGVHSWAPLFQKMPPQMRQGYRLAKIVRGSAVCPQIPQTPKTMEESQTSECEDETIQPNEFFEWSNAGEFMNTYLLKQVIMHEYTAWYDEDIKGQQPSVHSDLYWARRIYLKMEEAFEKKELYSWFIPSYNLLNEDKFVQFQETAILYARLCRRLLTEDAAAHFRRAYMGLSKDQ